MCLFVANAFLCLLWLNLSRGLAHLHHAALDNFGVDAAEAELFAQWRIDELHCLGTKARDEFTTTRVRHRADFEHR